VKRIIHLFLLLTIVPQWCGATQLLNSPERLFPVPPSLPKSTGVFLQQERGAETDEDDSLIEEDYEWGFFDSYPRLWMVPISFVGFYVGVGQIQRQFDLGNDADTAEERGDYDEEQKLRDQATLHELWAVLSLVTATILFSYGIKKENPDIFGSMLMDSKGDRAYLGLQHSF
jgi:hypothetical protein